MSRIVIPTRKSKYTSIGNGGDLSNTSKKIQSQKEINQFPQNLNYIQKDNQNQNLDLFCDKNNIGEKKRQYFTLQALPIVNLRKNTYGNVDRIGKYNFTNIKYNSKQLETFIKKNSSPDPSTCQQRAQQRPLPVKKLQSKQTIDTCYFTQTKTTSINLQRPPTLLNNQLDYIDRSEIIFKKDEVVQHQKNQEFIAFWKTNNCYVRVIRSENMINQYCEQQHQHKGLLKIYGKMKIKFFSFLVTENYQGFTLQSMLQQYGPCTQRLIKKFTKMLMAGLSTMNSKGHSYNILNPHNIFTDIQGNIAIDTAKARSSGRFTMEQKIKYFYYMSPELLMHGQIGFKNDTWSLGCVILAMILGTTINQEIFIHPYNQPQQLEKQFKKSNQKTQQILQKLIKFYKQYIEDKYTQNFVHSPFIKSNKITKNKCPKYQKNRIKKYPIQLQISENLYDFVKQCLRITDRHEIRDLSNHPFLTD